MIRRTLLLAAGTLCCCFLGCQPRRDPNVLILVIDALRPDHLGCYGYPRPTSPTLDALARRGVLFADATSPSSYTRAAVPSIFTSVHPGAHGVFSQGRQVEVLSDEYTTLAETLKARGYRTAAFMPNPSLYRTFNFGQGFDLYDDDFPAGKGPAHEAHETARKINSRFLRWLRGGAPEKPFFTYLHYRDVHSPYVPPPDYEREFVRGAGRPLTRSESRTLPHDLRNPVRYESLQEYVDRYDAEIRYTDDRIAELLDTLREEGLLDETVLFVTADHGEAFLEHSLWTHGSDVYEEQVRVPLLLVLPDERHAGRRIEAPVQTVDIYPTVLTLLGADIPPFLQGRSLLGTIDKADPQRPVYSEARATRTKRGGGKPAHFVAVRAGGWKLIYNRTIRRPQLFNLKKDPAETTDLFANEPDKARELVRLLRIFDQENAKRSHRTTAQQSLPDDVVEGLRSLGYVQ